MLVLEIILFCSYVNLLAMLPLFSARRLAEHMAGKIHPWYGSIIASPGWMSLAVIAATGTIAWKLIGTGEERTLYRRAVLMNSFVMMMCWVIPSFIGCSEWLQLAAMEIWTIASGLLLLLSSLVVPIKALRRAVK